ncbi:MAG: hypothetical protein XU14_C0031G0010 [Armatimonadetes bacterium CSP1-3]|nr:MAG: hypothetical protein XU14_C0031G0010 [Armatimonadetes bacterium CSP1-3]
MWRSGSRPGTRRNDTFWHWNAPREPVWIKFARRGSGVRIPSSPPTNQDKPSSPFPLSAKAPESRCPPWGRDRRLPPQAGGVANCTSPTLSIYAGNLQRFTICVRDTSRGLGNPADAEDLLPVVLNDRRRGNEALGTDQEQIALQHVFEKGETDLDVFEGRRLLAGPPSRGVRSDLLGDPVLFGPPGGAGSDAGELLRYSHLGDADGEVGHAVVDIDAAVAARIEPCGEDDVGHNAVPLIV